MIDLSWLEVRPASRPSVAGVSAGWSWLALASVHPDPALRLESLADLAIGDEILWDTVGGLVQIYNDGTWSADPSVTQFSFAVWDASQTIGTTAIQTVNAEANPIAGDAHDQASASATLTTKVKLAGAQAHPSASGGLSATTHLAGDAAAEATASATISGTAGIAELDGDAKASATAFGTLSTQAAPPPEEPVAMLAVDTILPRNATALERAIDRSVGARMAGMPSLVVSLWNADTCPAELLPYLAWALSVDEWSDGWSVDQKRAVIRESRLIHRQKGTPAAIKRALAALGQADATIIERGDYIRRDGTFQRDASHQRFGTGGWATYRVVLPRTTTIDLAQQIKRLLASVQRNCITLTAVDYRASTLRRNGIAFRNGTYTRGVVDTSI
jgi:phage tail P2-like protein